MSHRGYDVIDLQTRAIDQFNGSAVPALPAAVRAASWDGKPVKQRETIGSDFLPFREISLLNGHGGTNKTGFALQAAIATTLGTDVLGFPIKRRGPVVFYSAEEELEEMHRRAAAIMKKLNGSLGDLNDLHFICTSADDPARYNMALATVNLLKRTAETTPAFAELLARCKKIQPVLTVLENVADLFPGSENDRDLVAQHMSIAREIPRAVNGACLLLQHVSDASRASGEQKSGSTGWHNKARYRFSLSTPIDDLAKMEDDGHRELKFHKNQYGAKPHNRLLINDGGYLRLEPGEDSLYRAAREAKDEEIFLRLLDRCAKEGRFLSPHKTANMYIISVLSNLPEGRPLGRDRLTQAMERLHGKEVLRVGPHPKRYASRACDVVLRNDVKELSQGIENG
jgi:RecA-family ATPase